MISVTSGMGLCLHDMKSRVKRESRCRYTAEGLVNAKNGFGGYNGNRRYTCEATVDGKTVSATVRTLDTEP